MSQDYLNYYKDKKVMVAGGGGFLGSRIVARLKDAGATVFVPRTQDGVDFRDEKICHDYFAKTKPEIVINCAAFQGGIGFHSGKQANLFLDNAEMGLFLMEAAQKNGVKKFINIVAGCSYPGYLEKEELNESDYWNGEVHDSIFSMEKRCGYRSVFGCTTRMFLSNLRHCVGIAVLALRFG